MKHTDFYNMICQESGVITADETGRSECKVCHGTGKHFETSVKHNKGCEFMKVVRAMQRLMPDKSIPQVENQVSLGAMLPYLASLPTDDMDQIKDLVDCMKDATSEKERRGIAVLIRSWCPYVKADLLAPIIECGLPDDNAVITFRNYLIFEKSNANESLRIALELLSLENSVEQFLPKFKALLCDKYPHYAGASKKM
jgi:hypothetical protein